MPRIASPRFSVNIENGCNGLETALLLAAAVLAFPASWVERAAGFVAGFAVIQQREKRRVDALNERLAVSGKAVEKALDAERQRIASDFHDGPLQSFISLQMRLEMFDAPAEYAWDRMMAVFPAAFR